MSALLVNILWYWAATIEPSVSPFKHELLIYWWAVALSTTALSVLKGYFLAFLFISLAAFVGLVLTLISSWAILSWNLNFLLSFTTCFVLSSCAVKQLATAYLLETASNYLNQLLLFYRPFLNLLLLIILPSIHTCLGVMHSV